MTQLTADNSIKQAIPLTEFVDSVFAELSSHDNKWNPHVEDYGYYDNPDCWKDTVIPLAVRLYKLAQTDITVYWWLLRQMSVIDSCKDGKKFFGKSNVYEALSIIGLERSGFILENSVSEHVDELYEALKAKDLDTFRSYMPFEKGGALIYNICRVLKRIGDVRNIYEDTLTHTKGDALGKLFLLFRRYYQYFAETYEDEQRSCDGMTKNVFLALYQTQFREDKNDFFDVADWIGKLWMKSLMLICLKDKNRMPQSVHDVMNDVFQEGEDAKLFKSLENDFKDYDFEALDKAEGGWLAMEKYGFIWEDVFNKEWKKSLPPFSCKIVDGKRRPVVKGRERRDNCNIYLKSENAIPLAELLKHRNGSAKPFELIIVDNIADNESIRGNTSTNDDVCPIEVVSAEGQATSEETINQRARRLIGDLLPVLHNHLKSGCKLEKLEKFFDAILTDEYKPGNEQAAQEFLVKKLFNISSKYEYQGLKVIVFCRIVGYLLSEKVGILTGEPTPIAEKLQPFLTRTNVPNGQQDPNAIENLRSYIQKAKSGEKKPPGMFLINKVLRIKES